MIVKKFLFKMFFIILILVSNSEIVDAKRINDIQVMDAELNKVTHHFPNNQAIQNEVASALNSIDQLSKKINIKLNKGNVYKIPIEPSQLIETQWFHCLVSEVYLIINEEDRPMFIIFNDENRAFFVHCNYDTKKLLTLIHHK